MENKIQTTPDDPTHDEIAMAAYLIWEKEGRPQGRQSEHWQKAELQLRSARKASAASVKEAVVKALGMPETRSSVSEPAHRGNGKKNRSRLASL